jgi:hypothetical protein
MVCVKFLGDLAGVRIKSDKMESGAAMVVRFIPLILC